MHNINTKNKMQSSNNEQCMYNAMVKKLLEAICTYRICTRDHLCIECKLSTSIKYICSLISNTDNGNTNRRNKVKDCQISLLSVSLSPPGGVLFYCAWGSFFKVKVCCESIASVATKYLTLVEQRAIAH